MKRKLLLLLMLLPIVASAYDFEQDGIYYNILSEEEATCEVAPEYDWDYAESTYSGYANIPETVYSNYYGKEYTVVGVGKWAFYNCQLDGISLPSTIVRIEDSAFDGCKGISTIVFRVL